MVKMNQTGTLEISFKDEKMYNGTFGEKVLLCYKNFSMLSTPPDSHTNTALPGIIYNHESHIAEINWFFTLGTKKSMRSVLIYQP
ncbi:MAG: hypothetical protein C0593_08815 [Marinilabiliales bacterium]|nr:MAG: hypothetical protein C0593_08815 [Marinilabiliales bacterium]